MRGIWHAYANDGVGMAPSLVAFWADLALLSAVLGPVDFLAFFRFAVIWDSVVMTVSFLRVGTRVNGRTRECADV